MRQASLDNPPNFIASNRVGPRITLTSDTGAVAEIFVLEDDLVRLLILPEGRLRHARTWLIAPGQDETPAEGRCRFEVEGFSCPPFERRSDEPDTVVIQTRTVRLSIRLRNLSARWSVLKDGTWREAMSDRPTQAYDFGWWGGQAAHYVCRSPGEKYFGLGERSGPLDRAGRRFRLSNIDAMGYDAETSDPLYKHIPFYLTRRADSGLVYGVFYDTLSDCSFDFGCEHSNYHGPYRSFVGDYGDVDLYFIAGPTASAVTRRFTWLTGRPAPTPDWALGYSGSTMSYTDAPNAQARMAEFLEDLSRHQIPCSSFHLSSGYTSIGENRYVFHWNREKFPDPQRFVADFKAAGVRLIANIKPVLLCDHPRYQEASALGLLLSDALGAPVLEQFWGAPGSYLDFTNPATARWWGERVKEALLDYGIQATWNDNNEYEIRNPRALAHGFGDRFRALEMKPLQTILMLRASREAQKEQAPDETPFLVSRSGAAGLQRYGQTWSGDNFSSWKTLRWNIAMGLGLAMSGVSNTGHDIGGFTGPPPDQELFLRWIGLGVFLPRFSIHSWREDGSANEPWMYPAALDDVRELFALRARLIPYLSDLLKRYRSDYEPVMRPLFYDFPDDPESWLENAHFMLGPDVLVAPVTHPGALTRTVRLPLGADWSDGWSGERHEGGQAITLPAPLNRPPFLVRASGLRVPSAFRV